MSNDSRHNNHPSHQLTLQISQHSWSFLTVNLQLETGNFLILFHVVTLIDLTNGVFKLKIEEKECLPQAHIRLD